MKISFEGIVDRDGTMTDEDMQRYNAELNALITSYETEIPGSRAFGLSADIQDLRPNAMINVLSVSLVDKMHDFIPELALSDVRIEVMNDGTYNVKVEVGRS